MAFRDGPFDNLKAPLAWASAIVVIVAMIAAVVLLIANGRDVESGDYGAARAGADAVAAPVGGVFAAPVRWVGQASDYVRG